MTPTTIRAALHGLSITSAAPDGTPSREIVALAAPYGVATTDSMGTLFELAPGSLPLDGPAPKVYMNHDQTQAVGIVTDRLESADGVIAAMKISQTGLGDEALTLAADGVLDAVSVGLDVIDAAYNDAGVLVITSARWREVSLVPYGAFESAKVLSVAASEPEPEASLEETEDEEAEATPTPSEEDDMNTEAPETVATAALPISTRRVTAAEYVGAVVRRDTAIIRAAQADSSDVVGLLPVPVLQPVYDGLSSYRPLTAALGTRGMPGGGKTFIRPKVTTRPSVAVHSAEGAALSSTAMVIDDIVLTKALYGGFINVSEESIDWSDANLVALYIEKLGEAYARATEAAVCGVVEAGVGSTEEVADWTVATDVIGAIYTAATGILANTGDMPTHLILGSNRFKQIATLESTSGDFLFPSINPSSAFGQLTAASREGTPAGLTLVVSPELDPDTAIVGTANGAEVFEQIKGAVSVNLPSTAEVQIAWRGYMVSHVIDGNKFVGLVDPA